MTGPTPDQPDASKYANPEAALGGADAVEKTSYVTGKGTDPSGSNAGRPVAQVGSGGGIGPLGWAVAALVVFAVVALVLGMVG